MHKTIFTTLLLLASLTAFAFSLQLRHHDWTASTPVVDCCLVP